MDETSEAAEEEAKAKEGASEGRRREGERDGEPQLGKGRTECLPGLAA
jgi:hypothetical protein